METTNGVHDNIKELKEQIEIFSGLIKEAQKQSLDFKESKKVIVLASRFTIIFFVAVSLLNTSLLIISILY